MNGPFGSAPFGSPSGPLGPESAPEETPGPVGVEISPFGSIPVGQFPTEARPATIHDAVRAILMESAGVSSLVGDRVHYSHPRRDDPFPYITYYLPSQTSAADLDGGSDLAVAEVRIGCWSDRQYQATALADAVWSVLHGFHGPVGLVSIHSSLAGPQIDLPELPTESSRAIYQISCNYQIVYSKERPHG